MSSYTIIITDPAQKDIRRLDRHVRERIKTAVLGLADNPRPPGCTQIKSEPGVWRIRVGDWRVAYTIDEATKTVHILRVASRGGFYN